MASIAEHRKEIKATYLVVPMHLTNHWVPLKFHLSNEMRRNFEL